MIIPDSPTATKKFSPKATLFNPRLNGYLVPQLPASPEVRTAPDQPTATKVAFPQVPSFSRKLELGAVRDAYVRPFFARDDFRQAFPDSAQSARVRNPVLCVM